MVRCACRRRSRFLWTSGSCRRGRQSRHASPPRRREGRTAAAACRQVAGSRQSCPTRRASGHSNTARSRGRRDSAPVCPTMRIRPAPPPCADTRRSHDSRGDRAPSIRPRNQEDRHRRRGCPERGSCRSAPIRCRQSSHPPSAGHLRYGNAMGRRAGWRRRAVSADRDGHRSRGQRSRRPMPRASPHRYRRSVYVVWNGSRSPSIMWMRIRISLAARIHAGSREAMPEFLVHKPSRAAVKRRRLAKPECKAPAPNTGLRTKPCVNAAFNVDATLPGPAASVFSASRKPSVGPQMPWCARMTDRHVLAEVAAAAMLPISSSQVATHFGTTYA